MCWPHVHRNLESHFKHLRSLNKEISNELKKDIEDLQWAADSKESFLNVAKLLEKKRILIRTQTFLSKTSFST